MKIVKFKYYDEFHCVGSECRDSCCKHWSIDLTKREYLNYKKLDCSPELKIVIDTAFERIKNGDELQYAKMKLKEDGNCPFHDTDGLCMLQKELGEKALSRTCSVFPRLQAKIGSEVFIFSCNITCPHVIEILMSHPEGLEIVEEEYDGNDKYINKGLYSFPIINSKCKSYPYFWTIKNAETDILQNRNFTVQERLLILGFFCKKVDEYLENEEGQKIESLYNMLLDSEFCKKVADSLKAPQSDDGAAIKSMDIFVRMYDFIVHAETISLLRSLFQQVYEYLNVENGTKKDENGQTKSYFVYNKEKYNDSKELFHKIVSERPYILENILLNQAFMMSPMQDMFKNYFTLVVFYNNLKICVPAFLKEGYTDSDLALAFTYAAKMLLNTHLADRGTVVSFAKTDSLDLPHAAFLIS